MLGVEPLDLLNARASILGEVEDIDLAMGEDNSHADRSVAKAVDAALRVCDRIMLEARRVQQNIELAGEDASRSRSVRVPELRAASCELRARVSWYYQAGGIRL